MTEQTPQSDDARADPQASPVQSDQPDQRKGRLTNMLAELGLTQLIVLLLAVIFGWQWLDGHRAISDMQRQLAEKIGEMSVGSRTNQVLLGQTQDQVRDLGAKMALMEARYAEAQNQRAALEALYNDLSVNRDEMALAEVEQLLLIAEQQLRLSANVKAALIAMQSGDARLQRMDRAAFNGLRKAIGRDMDKLRALPNVDIPGINQQLNNLIASVDDLPLTYQQRVSGAVDAQSAADTTVPVWKRLLQEIWYEFRQLVRIDNTGKTEIPLLSPEQEFFLRENLKLRMLSARLALLSRDESSFRMELKTARQWTERYFDTKSSQCEQALRELQRLSASPISIELPDISDSLEAVRNYRLTRESDTRAAFEASAKSSQRGSR